MYRHNSILEDILEGGDISYEQETVRIGNLGREYQIPGPSWVTIRSLVRNFEPTNEETMFVRWMQDWMQSGSPLDICRFTGVWPVSYDMVPNPNMLGYDLRIEFRASSVDIRPETTRRDQDRVMAQFGAQTTGGLHPNAFQPYQRSVESEQVDIWPHDYTFAPQKKQPKKIEKHFDEDLFEL